MKKNIITSSYTKENGFKFNWIDGFEIETEVIADKIYLKGNKEGLKSLAGILLGLAEEDVPNNYHVHLDSLNSLEDGSTEIVIEKITN